MTNVEQLIDKANDALKQNRYEEALTILNHESLRNTRESIILKGEIYFKLQKWGEALNQFSACLEKFPEDKKAESYCLMIQNILGFYHKDLYNP